MKTELEKPKELKDSSENNKRKREDVVPELKEIEKDEKREVPLSKKLATTTLLITGFVRPFTTQAVQELLAQYGKIMTLWMDSIKTKAFVTYETTIQTTTARQALHNLVWPKTSEKKLLADFESVDDAKRIIAKSGIAPIIETKPPTLDELFRKTTTKPPLYYLPLTDAQIEERRKKGTEDVITTTTDGSTTKPAQPKESNESQQKWKWKKNLNFNP